MTWRGRASLAVAGALCIFLLIATGFIANTRPEGYFIPSLSNESPFKDAERDPGVAAPTPSPQEATEHVATPSPTPVETLQEFSRFDSYGLASGECGTEFKDLFKDMDRSVAHKKETWNVTSWDIDISWKQNGTVRAMIWRQKVFETHTRMF